MSQAKTAEQYRQAWKSHMKDFQSVINSAAWTSPEWKQVLAKGDLLFLLVDELIEAAVKQDFDPDTGERNV